MIINEQNLGIIDNFRLAVESSIGELVVFVGADNRITPDFIEKYLNVASKNPDAAIYCNDIIIFGPRASKLAGETNSSYIEKDRYHWRFP